MVNVNDISITELDQVSFYKNGDLRFVLDELQTCKLANTEEKVNLTGKAGRTIGSLKKNKAVTVSGTNGLVSGGLMGSQVGNDFTKTDSAPVKYIDYLAIANDNTATTTYTAAGDEGAEIESVKVKEDGVVTATLTQSDAAADGKFTYDPETKKLTFAEGAYEEGTEIVVTYMRSVKGYTLDNMSDNYSEKGEMYIDGRGEDTCGNVFHIQFYIPMADFTGNFDLDMGGDQTVHAFEATSIVSTCKGAKGKLWTYTIFGVEDVA